MGRRTVAAVLVGLLIAGLASLVGARPVAALGGMQIETAYKPDGLPDDESPPVDPCAEELPTCPEGSDRTPQFKMLTAAAAAMWSSIIRDDHSMKLHFWWTSAPDPTARVIETDDAGRATEARIVIPAHKSYYYDDTPQDDAEFEMAPRLYGDTHPTEQPTAFDGAPPEVLEVGYAGKGPGIDLFSIILHEMGHVMGLNRWTLNKTKACTKADPHYEVNPALVAGSNMSIAAYRHYHGNAGDPQDAFTLNSYTDDCEHLAAGGIKACKAIVNEDEKYHCLSHQALLYPGALPGSRSLPSAVDILAVATAAGWDDVHMPRRFAAKTGAWHSSSTWIGNRVPTAQNDVYLLRQGATVTASQFATAADVRIDNGSALVAASTVDAASLDVRADGAATVDGGMIDVWSLANHGVVQGRGTVKLATLDNDDTIRAIGGTLAFVAAYPNPTFDLGTPWDEPAKVHALAGNLVFHGLTKGEVAADVRVGSNRTLTFTQGWKQSTSSEPEHALHFEGGAGVATLGGAAELQSTVNVDGQARIASPVTFRPWVRVEVPQADDRLILAGDTTFHGGSYLGAGQIIQRGNAKTLGQATTIGPVGVYDWDGYGGATTTVPQSATLHIKAATIEADAGDGYDGSATVAPNGHLIVDTGSMWRLDGTISLNSARLGGMPLTVAGEITATGSARIDSRVDLPPAGALHIPGAGDVLTLTALGSKLLQGKIDGDGRLDVASGGGLAGNGVVETRAANSGFMAPGQSLLGPGDQAGRLSFARDFAQTSAGTLELTLNGEGPETFDEVAVRGTARLDGALVVRVMPGYVPAAGDEFLVMSWGAVAGAFETVAVVGLPDGLSLAVEYLPGALRLTVTD